MLKHYIEWFYPGSFFSETSVHEIADRAAPVLAPLPGAFGFRSFSRTEVIDGGEKLIGKAKDHGPMVYFGEALTLEELKALPEPSPGAHRILISNIECNGYERAVRTVRGNWQPLEPGDIVRAAEIGRSMAANPGETE